MAGITENTSPIVTQAAPTDTTTEEISSEKTVQLAQVAAAVQVASPGRGAEDSIAVEAGLTYKLVDSALRFTQDGGNLVVHWRDGGHTTLEDYLVFAHGPALAEIAQNQGRRDYQDARRPAQERPARREAGRTGD